MSTSDEDSPSSLVNDFTAGNASSIYDEIYDSTDYKTSYYSDVKVNQYAQAVIDFSSQYGSDYSISYTALNITGRPSKFPDYGDFPETFAMRTYGNWWDMAPSRVQEIKPQNLPKIPAHDFIIIRFEQFVIPEELVIYETYNPGAIVRIWAYTAAEKWVCLWEVAPRSYSNISASRFAPPLKKLLLPTNTIRLEFNHSLLHYFTEIDGVVLVGKKSSVFNNQDILNFCKTRNRKGRIVRKLESMKFRPNFNENPQSLMDFLKNDLEKFIEETAMISLNDADASDQQPVKLGLSDMPFEILLNIFSHLDLISLFRVGQVSKFLYDVSTHPLLYSELNLKPYWHLATSELLCTLAKRSTLMKKLDMSWCGVFNSMSPTEFKKFIQQRGDNLTHLRLNSCRFLNASCIETVGIVCDSLKELSLRNYSIDPPILNFSCLANLKNLERLDLFRTVIEPDLLLTMLESNRKLKHLNLAFCGIGVNMDDVAVQIAKYNKQLISLDMWKSHSLSFKGLQALSLCHELEEVDFGWCLREEPLPGESLKSLLIGCPKLKKLFLAAIRGITDRDVENIANLCPNLEQLDLMGVLGISTERCYEILQKCKKLKLLDLSFCDNIDENQIARWCSMFKVDIKRSFVPPDFLTHYD